MVLSCRKCGKPLAAVEVPEYTRGQLFALEKLGGALGAEGKAVVAMLSPSPAQLAEFLSAQCLIEDCV